MTRSRSVLILLVALVLSVSFAVPAEDDPETQYDESESLPYESSPAVPVAEVVAAGLAPVRQPCVVRSCCGCLRRTSASRLEYKTGWAYPPSDSLFIVDHALRC